MGATNMRMTLAEYLAYEARSIASRKRVIGDDSTPVTQEIPLHDEIIKYCRSQWPAWKFRHARTDKRTTEEIGVEDFTIFLPGGKTLHLELKAKDKKQTPEQLAWAKQLEMLGHQVHVIRSMEEFLQLTKL